MKYELWDAGSGNIVGWYDSLDELVQAAFGLGQVNQNADPQEFVAATVHVPRELDVPSGWTHCSDCGDATPPADIEHGVCVTCWDGRLFTANAGAQPR